MQMVETVFGPAPLFELLLIPVAGFAVMMLGYGLLHWAISRACWSRYPLFDPRHALDCPKCSVTE